MVNSKIRYGWLAFDLLATCVALYLASVLRLSLPFGTALGPGKEDLVLDMWVYIETLPIWMVSLVSLSVYDYGYLNSYASRTRATLLAILLSTCLLAGALYLSFRDVPRITFLYFSGLDVIFLIGPRLLFGWLGRRGNMARLYKRTLIVGASELGLLIANRLAKHPEIELLGFVDREKAQPITAQGQEPLAQIVLDAPLLGNREKLFEIVEEIKPDVVVLALPADQQSGGLPLVIELQQRLIEVLFVPDLQNSGLIYINAGQLDGMTIINLNEPRITGLNRLLKRALDIVLATIGLVVAAPLMLLIALLIRLDSPGPVIFRQMRVGECCRLFYIYKFRTMQDGADAKLKDVIRNVNGNLVHKHPDDPRITRFGRFLRKTSLDELPNLLNVLMGDMSIVGPRPELPQIVSNYAPFQFGRFSVPPGITGWWQINGRSDKPLHLHTSEDLYYIEHFSLWLDLQIILRTLGALITRRGAF